MSWWRPALIVFGAVLVLGGGNLTILQMQGVVENGRQVLLPLALVEGRPPIRGGDHMLLLYDRAAFPDHKTINGMPWRGTVVFALDGEGVGRFARLDDGTRLGPDEVRMTYRTYRERRWAPVIRLSADSFFFPKRHVGLYGAAVYGVLRVDEDGTSIVVGLADAEYQVIQPD